MTTSANGVLQIYDNFDQPGYSLTDYAEKWILPYGLGEMARKDTRKFSDGYLSLSAVPFRTASDVSVNDHLKYMAVSSQSFPLPRKGTVVMSSDIRAVTPGTVSDLTQHGVYGPTGSWKDPTKPSSEPGYSARLLQAQQAAVVMNVLDFCSGQLFDWFVASDTAFALIERLPSTVTGNTSNADCPHAPEVGIDKMYTQIIREVRVSPDTWHHVDIAVSRDDGELWVDYFLDHEPFAHIANVGIPLDKQGITFSGTYESVGSGERVADQLDSVRFGHGLFSLLDAFPFQHPGAPELSVSIPLGSASDTSGAGRARLFGQGASGSFANFATLTLAGTAAPANPSEIAMALSEARSERERHLV